MKLMGLMFGVDVEVDVEANVGVDVGVDTSGGGWRRYLLDRSSGPATFTSSLQPATSGTTQNLGHFDWLLLFTVTGKVKSSASANLMLKFENISSLD